MGTGSSGSAKRRRLFTEDLRPVGSALRGIAPIMEKAFEYGSQPKIAHLVPKTKAINKGLMGVLEENRENLDKQISHALMYGIDPSKIPAYHEHLMERLDEGAMRMFPTRSQHSRFSRPDLLIVDDPDKNQKPAKRKVRPMRPWKPILEVDQKTLVDFIRHQFYDLSLTVEEMVNGYIVKFGCRTFVIEGDDKALGNALSMLFGDTENFVRNYGKRFRLDRVLPERKDEEPTPEEMGEDE